MKIMRMTTMMIAKTMHLDGDDNVNGADNVTKLLMMLMMFFQRDNSL